MVIDELAWLALNQFVDHPSCFARLALTGKQLSVSSYGAVPANALWKQIGPISDRKAIPLSCNAVQDHPSRHATKVGTSAGWRRRAALQASAAMTSLSVVVTTS